MTAIDSMILTASQFATEHLLGPLVGMTIVLGMASWFWQSLRGR